MCSDILIWSKTERVIDMDDEKAGFVLNVIGQAVVDLTVGQIPLTKDNVIKRLEQQRYVGTVMEMDANREASDLVSKGA